MEKRSTPDTIANHGASSGSLDYEHSLVKAKYMGTTKDQQEMHTMGRVQELRRNFRFISVVAFGCTLIGSWEFVLGLIEFGLTDGGTAGMIYGYFICFAGFICTYMSIAEMASMAPTSSGQYHWVSEFAPSKVQKYLSFLSGWLVFTGWQAGITGSSFLSGTIIQGLLVLNESSYVFHRWQGTLLINAVALFAIAFNTFLANKLPLIENALLVIYTVGFLGILIPLWVLGQRSNAHDVFTDFNNEGGWSSTGTAVIIGISGVIPAFGGYDCIVHIAEETHDASRTAPMAMVSSVVVNGVMGLIMVITVCFTLGDVESILDTKTGFPFIQLFYNITKSYPATNFMSAIVLISFVASTISALATSSRQLWAFARDGGVPFASFIAKVNKGQDLPLNAIILSMLTVTLVSLINLGSTVALNAVISLGNATVLTSYMLTIACVLWKRIRRETLPVRRWSLGRWGLPLNIASLVFMCPLFVFVLFPLKTPATPESMNYGVLMFGAMGILSTVFYLAGGRKRYTPPSMIVRREEEDYDTKAL